MSLWQYVKKSDGIGFFILAAGKCERFGAPKFLFPFGGTPLLLRLFRECLLINPEHTYIITGAYHKFVASKVERRRLLYNPHYNEGMASSFRLIASKATELKLKAVVVLLSDQPMVDRRMLNKLLQCFEEGYEIASFEKEDEPCPPSIFGSTYYKLLAKLKGDIGAKRIIKEAKGKKMVKVKKSLLEDFDTVWDYLRLASKYIPERREDP